MTIVQRSAFAFLCISIAGPVVYARQDTSSSRVLTGHAAFVSSTEVMPSVRRKITVSDLPKPFATKAVATKSRIVPRPHGVLPKAPPSFRVNLFASGLSGPRAIRVAPNGDVFVAESHLGRVLVLHPGKGGHAAAGSSVYASRLHEPYGMAFYPPGPNPKWLYIANTDSVVRYAYTNGDLKARGKAETVIRELPSTLPRDQEAWQAYNRAVSQGKYPPDHGHWTRAIAFSLDGKHLFVGVGSASNLNDPDTHPSEKRRANILEYTPEGQFVRVYAAGIRNPSGVAVDPESGQLWCSVNERDGLGDNLPPDYITHVEEGGFYGWPWYYLGNHPDPRLGGKHPELAGKVLTPDVLLQAHSASLQMTFYQGNQFPAEYRGDIFAAQHGSWNRSTRSGYEVVRVHLRHGKANGVYEDFLTGFLTPDGSPWGRPVGIAVARDGSLLVSDDGSGSIWRVSYKPEKNHSK